MLEHGGQLLTKMSQKIKLENSHGVEYDRETGEPYLSVTEEYVCDKCRHIVKQPDKFCWRCGEQLEDTGMIEHHAGAFQVTHDQFLHMKQLHPKETPAYLSEIVPKKKTREQIKKEAFEEASKANR